MDVIVLAYEKMVLCQLPQKSLLLPACLNEGEDDFGVRRLMGRKSEKLVHHRKDVYIHHNMHIYI